MSAARRFQLLPGSVSTTTGSGSGNGAHVWHTPAASFQHAGHE